MYAVSLFAGGNINKSKAVIKDGKTYLIYDFDKKETTELTSEEEYKYIDFVNDNYLLINIDNKYYSYNLSEKTLSSEIVTDLLITNLDNKPYVVWDNNIITYDNNKYGIVSLSTGNSVYENDYEMINCYGNYCLLTKDELSNLYAYEKNDTDAVIKDIEVVKYFNDKYLAYLDNNSLVIYDLKTKESSKIDNFKKTNNIYSIDIKDKVITIKYTR